MTGSPGTVPAPDLPPGRRLALVIATTTYTDRELSQLRAPAQDAADLNKILADPQIGGFKVTSMINKSAQAIRLAVEDFVADRKTDDLLLLYLSCHGLLNDRRRLFFAAKDTRKNRLGATGVEAAWVMDQMEHCRARRQILILDSCYSGAFGNTKGGADVGLGHRFTGQGRGRIVLTASDATEYSYEGKPIEGAVAAGSIFTAALVDGLRTGAADADHDGHITVEDAYIYAFDKLLAAGAAQTPQRWAYKSEGAIVLARSPAGRTLALPEPLDSPFPAVRIEAIGNLRALLDSGDPAQENVAREKLREIADRDIPQVAAAARALLGAGQTAAKTVDSAAEATTGQSKPKPSRAKTAASQAKAPASPGTARPRERNRPATTGTATPGPAPTATPEPKPAASPKPTASRQKLTAGSQKPSASQKPPAASPKPTAASAKPTAGSQKPPAASQTTAPSAQTTERHPRTITAHCNKVKRMAFSPDGKLLATAIGEPDHTIKLWDPLTGRHLRTLEIPGPSGTGAATQPWIGSRWIAFSPDGRQFAANKGEHTAFLWDPATPRPQREIRVADFERMTTMAGFSQDGRRLAFAFLDGTVHWYDPATGRRLARVRLVGPHGGAAGALKRIVRGKIVYREGSMVFAPGLRVLGTAVPDTVEVWNPETGEQQVVLEPGRATGNRQGEKISSGEEPMILGFSPDGRLLVLAGQARGTVELHETATGQMRHRVRGEASAGVAFSPDGRVLATSVTGSVLLWDPATGGQLRALDPQRPSGTNITTTCLAFGPRGMLAAAQSNFRFLRSEQLLDPARLRAIAAQSPEWAERLKQVEQAKYPKWDDATVRVWT